MLKETYRKMYDQVVPDPQLVSRVLAPAQTAGRGRGRVVRRAAAVCASLLLAACLAAPVITGTLSPVHALAQFFTPVQKTCEKNGIQLEVMSAYIHDDRAEIYLSLRDLTGDRVDATTDLYDSYSIHRPFDSTASCALVSYDGSTRAATFLITLTEWGGHRISGDKITFSVGEFLSHKSYYTDIALPFDLSEAQTAPETQQVYVSGLAGDAPQGWQEKMTTLVPGEPLGLGAIEGVTLTGMGYVDGMLHVQTSVADSLRSDNHGDIYLRDAAGNTIRSSYSVSFWGDGETQVKYQDDVFDIPRESLGECTLYGDFVTSGLRTEGPWQVTFPLEDGQ